MPAIAGNKPSVMAQIKKRAADSLKKHKDDPVKISEGGEVPAGVEGGVAELRTMKFDTYKDTAKNAGKPYFTAAGICLEPAKHAGLRTVIRIDLFDKPGTGGRKGRTFDDGFAAFLNELRKFGINTSELGDDDFETVMANLVEEKPHFKFRTWAGQATKEFPTPRTNHDWRGLASGFIPSAVEAVEDETGGEGGGEGEGDGDGGGGDGAEDWEAIGAAADGGDEGAQAQIVKAAEELQLDIADIATWSESAALIASGGEGGEGEGEQVEEEWKPAKGDTYQWKPKGAKKAIECEVTAVFATTLNMKSLQDDRKFLKLSWTADRKIGGQTV